MTSPFLNLPRAAFGGEIMVVAAHVSYIEIAVSRAAYHLVIGLTSTRVVESPPFEATDLNLARLREYRDQLADDLAERLQADDRPAYAQLRRQARDGALR